ncbi:MAG: fimbrillin family protein [Bacteroides sp.]|nr:fimbrillin family protein [Bacteroides sp.]
MEEIGLQEGTSPIRFSAQINQVTRVSGSSFEQGDEIGLYAVKTGEDLKGERYINNLKLKAATGGSLTPEKNVHYPEENVALDFIAYYPYQTERVESGNNVLPVSVQTDQSDENDYYKSDFLWARTDNVSKSEEAVKLTFHHKFAKLRVELKPTDSSDVETLLAGNPTLIIGGFYTQAECNLSTGEIANFSVQKDIVPYGSWSVSEGCLVGKELIVIPQELKSDVHMLALEWNGKIYTSPISLNETLKANAQCTLTVSIAVTDEGLTFIGLTGEIVDWDENTIQTGNSSSEVTAVHVNAFTFNSSNVYRIYKNNVAVAEVCKEYLHSNEVDAQAITLYPVVNGETSIAEGTVLQLLNTTGDVHGGKVVWDVDENVLTYTAGTSSAIEKFYIDSDGKIAFDKPNESATVTAMAYLLRDLRDGVLQTYPIVKIGAQYWMREELKTPYYDDGTILTQRNKVGEGAGYFVSSDKHYFYNGEALLAGNLAPDNWRIPQAVDFDKLLAYAGSAAALKAGEWQSVDSKLPVLSANNVTNFYGYAVGGWYSAHISKGQLVGFWIMNEDGTSLSDTAYLLMGEQDDFKVSSAMDSTNSFYKGFSIRCIKE